MIRKFWINEDFRVLGVSILGVCKKKEASTKQASNFGFDALIACGVVVSSHLANKVRFSSMLRRRKDCGMTTRAPLALVIGLEPDASPSV